MDSLRVSRFRRPWFTVVPSRLRRMLAVLQSERKRFIDSPVRFVGRISINVETRYFASFLKRNTLFISCRRDLSRLYNKPLTEKDAKYRVSTTKSLHRKRREVSRLYNKPPTVKDTRYRVSTKSKNPRLQPGVYPKSLPPHSRRSDYPLYPHPSAPQIPSVSCRIK